MSEREHILAALEKGATLVKSGKPDIYQLKLTRLARSSTTGTVDRMLVGVGNPEAHTKRDIIVLVSGETGSGKTTWLNGVANFLYRVQFDDTFRIKVVIDGDNQADSQTSSVTAYCFEWQPWFPVMGNVVLVDTPGFADSRGLKEDERTVAAVEELFRDEQLAVRHLTAVALVVVSTAKRLTAAQKYVFDQLVSMFGRDVAGNFVIVATNSGSVQDGDFTNLRQLMEKDGIPVNELLGFENGLLFAANACGDTPLEKKKWSRKKDDWDELLLTYEHFFHVVSKFPREVSLTQSKEVLKHRRTLNDLLVALQSKMNEASNVKSSIRTKKESLRQYQARKDSNKEFRYYYDDSKWVQVDVPVGTYTTTCMHCHRTCHEDCAFANNDQKQYCCVMQNGQCRLCGCSWNIHENTPFKWVWKEDKGYRTREEMKRMYDQAVREAGSCEGALSRLRDSFRSATTEAFRYLDEYRLCLEELSRIAMRPQKRSAEDYLNFLIKVQKDNKPNGWERKVEDYEQALKMEQLRAKLGERVTTAEGQEAMRRLIDEFFGTIE